MLFELCGVVSVFYVWLAVRGWAVMRSSSHWISPDSCGITGMAPKVAPVPAGRSVELLRRYEPVIRFTEGELFFLWPWMPEQAACGAEPPGRGNVSV